MPLVERDHERDESRREQGRTRPIEPLPDCLGTVVDDERHGERNRDRADGQVDVEDGRPSERIGEPAAERRTDSQAEVRHRCLRPENAAALLGRKGLGENRRRVRKQHRRTAGLQRAHGDEHDD
jgi:hypothetical protein